MVRIVKNNFKRIEIAPAYQKVADAIELEIVSGRIKPGEPVGTEAELVVQFGVTRSTVREGIRSLQQSGLIKRDTGRRLFASLPPERELTRQMSRAWILHEVTIQEIFETANALEVAAARFAADRATEEDLAAMAANIKETEEKNQSIAKIVQLDRDFHALVAQASHNRALQLSRGPVVDLFFRSVPAILTNVPEGISRMAQAHHELYEAIQRRDATEASAWMRRHIEDWLRGFKRLGLPLDQAIK